MKKDDEAEYQKTESSAEVLQEKNVSKDAPVNCTIEEHAASLKISAPILAAVKEAKKWAAGKRVEKTEFEKAVKDFLNASVGSTAPAKGGK